MSNKKITDELMNFNKELEKHIPSLNLDFIKSDSFTNDNHSEENSEFDMLLANNLMDVKTEIALLRRNLSDNIENMILKVVSENQNNFVSRLNNIYSQINNDLRSNFASYSQDISKEVSSLRKELITMQTNNTNTTSALRDISDNLNIIKTQLVQNTQEKRKEKLEIDDTLTDISKKILLLNKKQEEKKQGIKKIDNKLIQINTTTEPIRVIKEKKSIIDETLLIDKNDLKTSNNVKKILLVENRLRRLEELR